jgi:uncharacterized membrane protein YGL010W
MDQNLLNLFANIIVLGLVMWLINAFIPMPGAVKSLLNIVVVIVIILWILQFFGIIQTIVPMYRLLR